MRYLRRDARFCPDCGEAVIWKSTKYDTQTGQPLGDSAEAHCGNSHEFWWDTEENRQKNIKKWLELLDLKHWKG